MSKVIEVHEYEDRKYIRWTPDNVESNADMLEMVKKLIEVMDRHLNYVKIHKDDDWDAGNIRWAKSYKETLDKFKEIEPFDCDEVKIYFDFEPIEYIFFDIYRHVISADERIYKKINPVIEKLGY